MRQCDVDLVSLMTGVVAPSKADTVALLDTCPEIHVRAVACVEVLVHVPTTFLCAVLHLGQGDASRRGRPILRVRHATRAQV